MKNDQCYSSGPEVSYHMSQEEEAALIGKVVMEIRDVTEALNTRRAKAKQIGEQLARLGGLLTREPEEVIFNSLAHDGAFGMKQVPFSTTLPTVNDLHALCTDIRTLMKKLNDLNSQKAQLRI